MAVRSDLIIGILIALMTATSCSGRTLIVRNNCSTEVTWAIEGTRGLLDASPARRLSPGDESSQIVVPHGWGGRIWNNSTQDRVNTLAEFFIDDSNDDFYDINIVDGFDSGMRIVPSSDDCPTIQCSFDMAACPADLAEYDGAPCLSACSKYAAPEFCCTGYHRTPETCPANELSLYFKTLCPDAYTYAFDDPTSVRTCGSAPSYTITMCP